MTAKISLNRLTLPLLNALVCDASALNLHISRHVTGAQIVDAGIQATGGLEAGRRIAEICMASLGEVSFAQLDEFAAWPQQVCASATQPVLACLASQYAGWSLSHEKFFSLGSGPARAIAQREEIFKELNYSDSAQQTVLVLETDQIPPTEVVEKVACDTKIAAENLTFILTPTSSLAGVTQVVARVLEVALHKAHTLHFDLNHILAGHGHAPLPPVSRNFITGMGRTNDAILYGGTVHLTVAGSLQAAQTLAQQLPSNTSPAYGKPFADIFKAVNMDFYQIDPHLFSPALVYITHAESGQVFSAGELNDSVLNQSFGS